VLAKAGGGLRLPPHGAAWRHPSDRSESQTTPLSGAAMFGFPHLGTGAAVANAILSAFGIVLGGWIGYLIAGFIGACLLIWIARAIWGRGQLKSGDGGPKRNPSLLGTNDGVRSSD
jgi:hypothetical protein